MNTPQSQLDPEIVAVMLHHKENILKGVQTLLERGFGHNEAMFAVAMMLVNQNPEFPLPYWVMTLVAAIVQWDQDSTNQLTE